MNWLILLRRLWPYIAIVLALGALWVTKSFYETRYARLSADFSGYRTETANTFAKQEAAARQALEQQIRERNQTLKSNAETLHAYEDKMALVAADRDHSRELVRRLLAAGQAGRPAKGGRMPEADHRSGSAGASGASGDGSLASLLGDAAAEFDRNRYTHDALISQLKPQL